MYDGQVIRFGTIGDVVSDLPEPTGQRIRVPPNIQHLGFALKKRLRLIRDFANSYGNELTVGLISFAVGGILGGIAGGYLGKKVGSATSFWNVFRRKK